jgi:putative flavoprotein involved in K+ transport
MRHSTTQIFDVIVVGAGHAGLSISYFLSWNNLAHIVFERGKIANSWRSSRWDSFKLNSANKINLLPSQAIYFQDPEAFCSASDFAASLESYVTSSNLPVKENCTVTSIEKRNGQEYFTVSVSENGSIKNYDSKQIVVASGAQNEKLIPQFAKYITPEILQLHTSEYKNVRQLPYGNVLVAGSAQSGTQITEDLINSGKKVFLSTGSVGRIPRRYRGKDILDWLIATGFYDVRTEDVTDPFIFKIRPPQVSGVGERGHTSSLQSLARNGAVILGKAANADSFKIFLQPNAAAHVKFADEFSINIKNTIDDFIDKNHLSVTDAEEDNDDIPDREASCASLITKLNLTDSNITSIIWATGFTSNLSYVRLPVLTDDGKPIHHNGISSVNGLFFLGFPWLRSRKSGIIYGIAEDAEFIFHEILKNHK